MCERAENMCMCACAHSQGLEVFACICVHVCGQGVQVCMHVCMFPGVWAGDTSVREYIQGLFVCVRSYMCGQCVQVCMCVTCAHVRRQGMRVCV